ncbi:L-seryl-tRNA(Sec) selenium transferase [Methylocella sp.]|uniref:L-seryl-tRNA(Sec) selenium transferase n=1 Tax=Methylocella sp. TaxID=1978226 RepID=UPI0035AF012F
MDEASRARLRALPSVDALLTRPAGAALGERFGRPAAAAALRAALEEARAALRSGEPLTPTEAQIGARALARLEARERPGLRAVYNLTGVILHTNLGRAQLAEAAVEAAVEAMREAVALEFDLETGRRGEREDHARALLRELAGAQGATIVNNNAAAVLLALNTLADGREAIVSRGELIEIGGAFRMPDIMARAGARLVEVGTTNRTHLRDYRAALSERTGVILKVHPSNYRVEGFVAEAGARELAELAREAGVPLMNDLGSGALIDLSRYGVRKEPTVREAVEAGADIIAFSGDKLLGGPQAGVLVGRRDLIEKIERNPMKRAMRVDKIRLAALAATLRLYADPDRLALRLPALRFIARPLQEIAALARRIEPALAATLGPAFLVEAVACRSEIGSGALPLDAIASAGLAIRPREGGGALDRLSAALRGLPRPVIGRIEDGALILDLRCLEDEEGFLANFARLRESAPDAP